MPGATVVWAKWKFGLEGSKTAPPDLPEGEEKESKSVIYLTILEMFLKVPLRGI
jgi:hypothetical protein